MCYQFANIFSFFKFFKMSVQLSLVHLAAGRESETVNYEQTTISNGYGLLTQAGVSVQRGVTAHINVDMVLHILTDQQIQNFVQSNKSHMSDDTRSKVEQSHSSSGIFGFLFGKSEDYFENKSSTRVVDMTEDKKAMLENLHQMQKTKVRVTGTIDAVGQSYIPVDGHVYVKTTSIHFSDGTTLTSINSSDTMVADVNGSTNGVQQGNSNKLNVVPLS